MGRGLTFGCPGTETQSVQSTRACLEFCCAYGSAPTVTVPRLKKKGWRAACVAVLQTFRFPCPCLLASSWVVTIKAIKLQKDLGVPKGRNMEKVVSFSNVLERYIDMQVVSRTGFTFTFKNFFLRILYGWHACIAHRRKYIDPTQGHPVT